MLNTIQSVFLSETHVFVSISRLFQKNRVFYTPKMAQKFVFPESGLEKFFHDSKMRAIDSPTRKTLVRSKISTKIDFNILKFICNIEKHLFFLYIDTKTWVLLKKTDWIVFSIYSYPLLKKNFIENGWKMMKLEHFFEPQGLIGQPNTLGKKL